MIREILFIVIAGGTLAAIVTGLFNYSISKRKILFESRLRAYTGLTSGIANNFLDRNNILMITHPERRMVLNNIFSEAILLSNKKLIILIEEYKKKLLEIYKSFDDGFDKEKGVWKKYPDENKYKELDPIVDKIHDLMRRDLNIKSQDFKLN